jgi:alkanesulfonate monooxygenase SsuD/methylene tetrahydromethanopterin reductase-like flavin-dependent oxidoreductase (luciferase family)
MRFGLSFLPDATPRTKAACDYYDDALELSARADEAGLHFVKITEHYLHPYGGYCPSPVAFLSAVAARTSRVRLLTGGVLPVFHHPLELAASTSMLDAISGGRAEIGFARAYLPYEFEAFGVDMDGSRKRFVETVDAVIRLWREPEVTIENDFFAFYEATSLPRCTQQPHPPVWVAAVQSRQSFAWIGQEGHNLLVTPGLAGYGALGELLSIYRECFTDGDHDRAPQIALSLPVFVAESEARAAERADPYLARYLDVWRNAAEAWNATASTDYPRYSGLAHGLRAESPETMRTRKAALVSSPERVRDEIAWLEQELGVDVLLMQVDFGAMPGDLARSNLELFLEQVWPTWS